MGSDQVTTRNHPLVKIDKDKNLLLIKGRCQGKRLAPFHSKAITARVKAAE
jgi:ribosomal protein L3